MTREGDEKRSKADKAKLDSKGRPIAVKAPEEDRRADGEHPVKVAIRMGCLLLMLSWQTGCVAEAQLSVADSARINSALAGAQAASVEAKKSAAQSRESASTSLIAAKAANSSAQICMGEASKAR